MSVCQISYPARKTFGLGIFPARVASSLDGFAARLDEWDRVLAETKARLAITNRNFALHVAMMDDGVDTATADAAWEAGYAVGRDGVDAAPILGSHSQVMAWTAGYERGLDESRREDIAATEAFLTEIDFRSESYIPSDMELCEARMA